MGQPGRFVLPAFSILLAALMACSSSSQDKAAQGLFAVRLGTSRPAESVQPAEAAANDPMPRLRAASVTVAEIEARRSDGTFVTIDGGLPAVVDLVTLAREGSTATLPANLLPEGHYTALQVRMTAISPTWSDGTRVTIRPGGADWSMIVPADFGVVADRSTTVALNVRLDQSFKMVNGTFSFDPELEISGIERD